MIKQLELFLRPEEVANNSKVAEAAQKQLGATSPNFSGIRILKRSIDARSRQVKIRLLLNAYIDEPIPSAHPERKRLTYPNAGDKKALVIIGAGPAGMFAALRALELGLKPIVIERGKDVRSRRRDLAAINKEGIVNPDSNYCFGEGGAGTYSDGKLYTRSSKRGDIQRILNILIDHGADENILIDAHPHIGTNKLPGIVTAISETILASGGEIHFNSRFVDIEVNNGKLKSVSLRHVLTNQQTEMHADAMILATGHSARDIFELLYKKDILIESKPFALGVRIEHPQHIIDTIQYHCNVRDPYLPPSSYALTNQSGGRGVYSFCMCPGGIIAPAATDVGEVVVNGWSPSKRNNPYANSGMVVSVDERDFKTFKESGVLSALRFQQQAERAAFATGGASLKAPAQRLVDFVENKFSATLPSTSYTPGVTAARLEDFLPHEITEALRNSFKVFGSKMKGYLTNEAVLVGVESRTSSPVRIPRDSNTLQHPQVNGLFPCAEGSGYAGGIVSAAMDGERCVEKAAEYLSDKLKK